MPSRTNNAHTLYMGIVLAMCGACATSIVQAGTTCVLMTACGTAITARSTFHKTRHALHAKKNAQSLFIVRSFKASTVYENEI